MKYIYSLLIISLFVYSQARALEFRDVSAPDLVQLTSDCISLESDKLSLGSDQVSEIGNNLEVYQSLRLRHESDLEVGFDLEFNDENGDLYEFITCRFRTDAKLSTGSIQCIWHDDNDVRRECHLGR